MDYSKKRLEEGGWRADPLPSVRELQDYYAHKYYQDANGTTSYDASYTPAELEHKVLEAKLALTALKAIAPNSAEEKSLVEFGCGEGFFLNQALTKTDWEISGIDFSKYGVEKWHPEIMNRCVFGNLYDYLEQYLNEQKSFNFCVLRNVLEHVIDPYQLLIDLKQILKKDGFLLITVPNDYSPIQKRALESGRIENEFWFAPPDHLYYFNTSNIIKFVHTLGYQVIDMFSSFPIDFFLFHSGSNYARDKKNGKEAHFARVELDLLMAESGLDNLLELYRAMAKCGVGRDVTIIIRPNS